MTQQAQTTTVLGIDEVELENTSIEEIDSEEVHLVFVGVDQSGSMDTFIQDMRKSLTDFRDSLINSKEADKILVARASFDSRTYLTGYKKIPDFDVSFDANGATAMYDVIVEGKEKLVKYYDHLKSQGMRVKAVFAIFSDGQDNQSRMTGAQARQAIEDLNGREITTAFISFGGAADQVAHDLSFKNILAVGGSASELRKAFDCLSKSVIESSKSVVATPGGSFFQGI